MSESSKPEFLVDLTKIDGDGAFPCPKCGQILDPEQHDWPIGKGYIVLKSNLKDGQLDELFLQCFQCDSVIRVTGFGDSEDNLALEMMKDVFGKRGIVMEKVKP